MFLRYFVKVETVKCNITVGYYQRKLHQTYRIMLHRNGPVEYKIWGAMQQCVYRAKICAICDLQKCLTQTWVDFEQNVIEWRLRLTSGATV